MFYCIACFHRSCKKCGQPKTERYKVSLLLPHQILVLRVVLFQAGAYLFLTMLLNVLLQLWGLQCYQYPKT